MTTSELEEIYKQVEEFQRCVREGDDAGWAFNDDPRDLVIRLLDEVERLRNACGEMLIASGYEGAESRIPAIGRKIGCTTKDYEEVQWK